MEINKASKIISLPDYREQKNLKSNIQTKEPISPLSEQDTTLIKPETTESDNVFDNKSLTNSQAYIKAKSKLIDYFKKDFIKSEEFIKTFGELNWDEISDKVAESIFLSRDKDWEKDEYNDSAFAFTGRVYGLYTEIVIDRKNGRLKKAYVEID